MAASAAAAAAASTSAAAASADVATRGPVVHEGLLQQRAGPLGLVAWRHMVLVEVHTLEDLRKVAVHLLERAGVLKAPHQELPSDGGQGARGDPQALAAADAALRSPTGLHVLAHLARAALLRAPLLVLMPAGDETSASPPHVVLLSPGLTALVNEEELGAPCVFDILVADPREVLHLQARSSTDYLAWYAALGPRITAARDLLSGTTAESAAASSALPPPPPPVPSAPSRAGRRSRTNISQAAGAELRRRLTASAPGLGATMPLRRHSLPSTASSPLSPSPAPPLSPVPPLSPTPAVDDIPEGRLSSATADSESSTTAHVSGMTATLVHPPPAMQPAAQLAVEQPTQQPTIQPAQQQERPPLPPPQVHAAAKPPLPPQAPANAPASVAVLARASRPIIQMPAMSSFPLVARTPVPILHRNDNRHYAPTSPLARSFKFSSSESDVSVPSNASVYGVGDGDVTDREATADDSGGSVKDDDVESPKAIVPVPSVTSAPVAVQDVQPTPSTPDKPPSGVALKEVVDKYEYDDIEGDDDDRSSQPLASSRAAYSSVSSPNLGGHSTFGRPQRSTPPGETTDGDITPRPMPARQLTRKPHRSFTSIHTEATAGTSHVSSGGPLFDVIDDGDESDSDDERSFRSAASRQPRQHASGHVRFGDAVGGHEPGAGQVRDSVDLEALRPSVDAPPPPDSVRVEQISGPKRTRWPPLGISIKFFRKFATKSTSSLQELSQSSASADTPSSSESKRSVSPKPRRSIGSSRSFTFGRKSDRPPSVASTLTPTPSDSANERSSLSIHRPSFSSFRDSLEKSRPVSMPTDAWYRKADRGRAVERQLSWSSNTKTILDLTKDASSAER
ncbi:hypothetical protein HK105_203110 [Polyrhizophydium stewartii]|uniref:PH domain-containing protein n=1 Tax=Polyrhizophydium stewartii TaxID=2732419 RepID=A0ABR4ND86_9FUNG